MLFRSNRGGARALLRDFHGAVADYSAALRINVDDIDALLGRAGAYEELGDLPRARADYARLTQLLPASRDIRERLERTRPNGP